MTNTETQVQVQRVIDAPAHEIFDVLTNPERHAELDGSGMVRSVEKGQRLQQVGDVFTMNMEAEHMGGEYRTDNHVSAYAENSMIGWRTAPEGTEPKGWEWLWELKADGPEQTLVTHTYDWSKVTDKALLAKNIFPVVTAEQLETTLDRLAQATTGA